MDVFSTMGPYEEGYKSVAQLSNSKSPGIPGVSQHSAMFSTWPMSFRDDLISFLAYVKSQQVPILSVALPDVRSVLGRGASFFVNGAEMPDTYVDETTGESISQGSIVALKRVLVPSGTRSIQDGLTRRINLLFNEVLTMCHPPLAAHPNIVKLRGIGFEVEGPESDRNVMPFLVPECAELGNLAEVLETAKREDRPLNFEQKLSLCVDVAHGLEALHACDIVHGDVKPENALVFEVEDDESERQKKHLMCKLTDFGFSHLDASSDEFPLGGSPPWQAPECMSGKYFKIETAKRTDIYSFGLLLWRVMLDGDPFSLLSSTCTIEGKTERDYRLRRNEIVASLKEDDKLSDHACESLKSSGIFNEQQLSMLHRVIRSSLAKDPSNRELHMARLIRLLSPDFWYQTRQSVPPKRISLKRDVTLLDIEKSFHELRKVDVVVHEQIASSYRHYATGSAGEDPPNIGAAYQLAICYTIGFGVPFKPEECLRWLNIAAMGGSFDAQQALPTFAAVFNDELSEYVVAPSADNLYREHLDLPDVKNLSLKGESHENPFEVSFRDSKFYHDGKVSDGRLLLLHAAEMCRYDALETLLANGASGAYATQDGVTALHFVSIWEISKVKSLATKVIQAGGDINAVAQPGSSIGGTPLMWSVMEDRQAHSSIIMELGGNPMAGQGSLNALTLSARLHMTTHLRLLLGQTKPAQIQGWLHRLVVAAASGESRYARVIRHGKKWETAPSDTLQLLKGWNSVFQDAPDMDELIFQAVLASLDSSWGPSNTDIQAAFLDAATVVPKQYAALLKECIVRDNKELFDHLMKRHVPTTETFENEKTCLHFCAQNPNNTTTITYYAKRLLESPDVDINARDSTGQTPFMDALLARKWDLAHLLLHGNADALTTNNAGYNIIGLIIQTLNLGAAKWALKYSGAGDMFRQRAFIVHPERNISAIQEAARIILPRAHGMKTEVSGLFLFILSNFMDRYKIDYRSSLSGLLPNATALDIAASQGNVHAVKALCKKGAHLASGPTALKLARGEMEREESSSLRKKNLERCVYIMENWEKDPKRIEAEADGWTKLKTLDESNVRSSWEVIAWEWKVPPPKGVESELDGATAATSGVYVVNDI